MNWFQIIKCDWYSFKISYPKRTIVSAFYLPDFKVVFIYRLSQLFYKSKVLIPFAYFLVMLNDFLHGVWISFKVDIGPGVFMGHPRGLVINPDTKIGKNLSLIHQITFGGEGIIIGDNVEIHSGAKIINNKIGKKLIISDEVVIGASAVVLIDVSPYSIIVGIPGKVIKSHIPGDNWFSRKEEAYKVRKNKL